jgi:colanic acid/amylovoran biosynthesis glycosyltransferase
MKVLILTVSWPYGFAEQFIEDEIKVLSKRTNTEVYVAPLRPITSDIHANGVSQLRFLSKNPNKIRNFLQTAIFFFRNPLFMLRTIWILAADLQNLFKNLLVIPRTVEIWNLVKNESITHVHAFWASTPATVAYVLASKLGVDWSFTAHRHDVYSNNLADLKSETAKFIRFISGGGEKFWLHRNSAAQKKTFVIPLGTEVIRSAKRQNTSENLTIHCPASFIPIKGHQVLLQALSEIPESIRPKTFLYGSGPLEHEIRNRIKDLKLDNFVFQMGQIPREILFGNYQNYIRPLVVLPSLHLSESEHEGIPFSLIEAMGRSVPVISTRSGSIEELLGDISECLVNPGDVQELKLAIERFILSKGLYEAASERCFRQVSERWNAAQTAEYWHEKMQSKA